MDGVTFASVIGVLHVRCQAIVSGDLTYYHLESYEQNLVKLELKYDKFNAS